MATDLPLPETLTTATTTTTEPDTPQPPPPTQLPLEQPQQPTKRQRRPSVRLGEIDTHVRHPKPTTLNTSWRLSKDTAKARSLTNLVNGNANEVNDQGVNEVNLEFTHRKKAKRTTSKRWKSSWVSPKPIEFEPEDEIDEGFRDFARDSESPNNSGENAVETWQDQRRMTHEPSRERLGRVDDGVRTFLIELGLSRYAPVFEVHEVDDEVLPLLTLEDLKDMGINAVGSRRKIFSAIQKFRKGFA